MGIFNFLFGKKKENKKQSVPPTNNTDKINHQQKTTEVEVKKENVSTEPQINKAPLEKAPTDRVQKTEVISKPKDNTSVSKKVSASSGVSVKKEENDTSAKTKAPESQKTSPQKITPKPVLKKEEVKPEAVPPKKDETIIDSKTTRSGKFEIKKAKDGRYVFNLYASNHVIVATSQVYTSSQSAMTGIKSVMTNAAKAPVEDQTLKNFTALSFPKWELYQDKGGQFRFRLLAANGSCVVHSQGYTTKANCKKGIDSIVKFAEDAEISKAYLKKDDEK